MNRNENERNYENLIRGLRQLAADVIPIAAKTTGLATTNLPTIDIVLVPDNHWRTTQDNIPLAHKYDDNTWREVKAVAIYAPCTFADRLRIYEELQKRDPHLNYDSRLDYNAMIFIHQPRKPTTSQEEIKCVTELYLGIASACFPLAAIATVNGYGISPILDPMTDQNACDALDQLASKLTPEEFRARYCPVL